MKILVTGGSSGLGKAVVTEMAKDKENIILFTYYQHEDISYRLSKDYSNVKGIQVDFTNSSSVDAFVEFLATEQIDVLVNNAYIGNPIGTYFHKTDSKDCLNIATVYYTRCIRKFESDNNDIKSLSRRKRDIREERVRQRGVYHRYLDLIWPCFDEYFDVDSKVCDIIVSTYKHPYVIKRRSVNMVVEILLNNGHFSKNRVFDIAYKIKDYASNCVSGVDEKSDYVNALISSYSKINSLKKEIEEINLELDNSLRKSIVYQLLKTVPGVGENLLIQMSAEIGDYTRFKTAKQFVAYIGLDPSILQSGANAGEHYSITRKGNGILRSCLYLAVSQMLTQKLDNQITRFYFKKKSSGLSHKVAAVASCRKLACCVFGMLKNGTCFETI